MKRSAQSFFAYNRSNSPWFIFSLFRSLIAQDEGIRESKICQYIHNRRRKGEIESHYEESE